MSEWINVDDELPPHVEPLIVCSKDGVVQRSIYYFDAKKKTWSDWYEEYDKVAFPLITHWQPLPEPPQ